jgi:hypothetical protein
LPQTKISTQAEAIKHFMEKMDIEMIDAFLDEDRTYQDNTKHYFLSSLKDGFGKFTDKGDTHLIALKGKCDICDKTKTGFTFLGNNSNKHMSVIFEIKKNRVTDLYECTSFKNSQTEINLDEMDRIKIISMPF